MQTLDDPSAMPVGATRFAPLPGDERIEALDVVRGFALFGIFLMNVEFFNRPIASIGEGLPRGPTGLDLFAGWFVAYFVQGKFWTIFSMLFGMGFAVMLVRAERAGRPFIRVYLRRIVALAVFGALHYVFLWPGDILFSYAVGALGLLIVLYGRARPILAGCAVLCGLGAIPGADLLLHVASGVATFGLLALYLRSERRVRLRGVSLPVFSVLLLTIGALLSIAAVVLWALPDGPIEPRVPLTVLGPTLLVTGWLSWRYHAPAAKRSVRMAVAIYVFGGVVMTGIGLVDAVTPDPETVLAGTTAPVNIAVDPARKARVERATKHRTEREKDVAEHAADRAEERDLATHGSYGDNVASRARAFVEKAANDFGFAVALVAMFLLGTGFVRSGVMAEPEKHLPFFRKLAWYGLPTGIGLGLVSGLIATTHVPGDRHDGWMIASGLRQLGNLPACVGYVGLVVSMLYSRRWSWIRGLAPAGRMALTNYLAQSAICATYFFGYGLGHWGMPRAEQVLSW